MSLKSFYIFIFLLVTIATSKAAIVVKTLYINRGVYTTVGNTTFPTLAFNKSSAYSPYNEVFNLTTFDSLVIKVINNDTIVHGFNIKSQSGLNFSINPTDSIIDTLTFVNEGLFIYYDQLQYPNNSYLGLAGMIVVNNSTTNKKFYWNIKEHQTGFNNSLATGGAVNWTQYLPDYFTINARSYPDILSDTTAIVTGNVNDTIYIFVANTGNSYHSLHFHGYHCTVLYSSANNMMVNSSKDTFPVGPMQSVVLEMVPDKPGKYPVHDHNLQATIGGSTYPNGMMLIMDIK